MSKYDGPEKGDSLLHGGRYFHITCIRKGIIYAKHTRWLKVKVRNRELIWDSINGAWEGGEPV